MMRRRETDAEAELNLPPGFRFHPTDEELVLHYLCRKITYQTLSVPIIAEIDLYKYNPSQLPDMALFGTKEWYFFTPRDRKYPNGSRPNRAAGSGYWKATGADKPIRPTGTSKTLGIKKALVFYSGKAPKGTKTNWIMHEYRLAEPNRPTTTTTTTNNNKGSLRLDDWVLCRIYNKKNNWHLTQNNPKEEPSMEENAGSESFSFTTSDSDMDNGESIPTQPNNNPSHSLYNLQPTTTTATQQGMLLQMPEFVKQDSDWFMDLNLDDLKNSIPTQQELTYQDYLSMPLTSPHFKPYQTNLLPFWSS